MYNYDLSGKNKYYKLYKYLRDDILSGKICAGDRLPSKRTLAAELNVSQVTVQLALDQLSAEGYIRSVERSGCFAEKVSRPTAPEKRVYSEDAAAEEKYKIDFVKGNTPPDMFPFSVWSKLMRAVLSDCGEHLLERVPAAGDRELRVAISKYLYRARGLDVDPGRIIIGAGAEYLYGVIVQLLGRDRLYAVENPGYGKISSSYDISGARWTAVDVGKEGMDISALQKSGATVAHVSPSHQFPTGAVMPVAERSRLIGWAKSIDGYVVEDDYDSEFRLTGKPLQCAYGLCPDRVIYLNTFSKSLAPSMRMGYMVLPPALFERFSRLFSSSANAVPLFEQKTLAAMLDGGYFERHVSRLKNYYRGIRDALLKKLSASDKCEAEDTGSGLHIIVKFPYAESDEEIKRKAREKGINIKCLSDYLLKPFEGAERRAVLNYSGLTPDGLRLLNHIDL